MAALGNIERLHKRKFKEKALPLFSMNRLIITLWKIINNSMHSIQSKCTPALPDARYQICINQCIAILLCEFIKYFVGGLFQSTFLSLALKVSGKKTVSLLLVEEIYGSLSWIKSLPGFESFSGKSSWIVDDVLPIAIDCHQTLLVRTNTFWNLRQICFEI